MTNKGSDFEELLENTAVTQAADATIEKAPIHLSGLTVSQKRDFNAYTPEPRRRLLHSLCCSHFSK